MKLTTHDGCLIIGEVAQSHDGSLGMAHAFIDAIASAGADAVKFQTHIAAAESSLQEPWRIKFSRQDVTRYDYWRRMEFTEEQWHGLAEHARDRNLLFLSSPFSCEAVQLLLRVGVPAWKIASGEVSTGPLLEEVIKTGLPVLLSTGMSALPEIDETAGRLRAAEVLFAVLQCTTKYPCPPEQIGLNLIPFFAGRYGCAAGLSDHSGTIYPSLAAVTLGAKVVEVHVTMSREMFGPDVAASVTTAELRQVVEGIRFIERSLASPVDKDSTADEMRPLRRLFTKSVAVLHDLPAGKILDKEDLGLRKPGTGIPSSRLGDITGRRLVREVRGGTLLSEDDFEEVV